MVSHHLQHEALLGVQHEGFGRLDAEARRVKILHAAQKPVTCAVPQTSHMEEHASQMQGD